jgi:hypothetical protein
VFEFVSIPSIINNSSLTAVINYEQTGAISDPLTSFIIKVYNSQNSLVYNSNVVYVSSSSNLQVTIDNLEEDNYLIIAEGETKNGFSISTQQNFSVSYNTPNLYSSMYLDNLYDKGQIRITSNIIGLQGEVNGEEIYIDDTMIDLRNEDTYLTFEKGFLVQSNFYFKL